MNQNAPGTFQRFRAFLLLGTGDWKTTLTLIPNPQSPIPNPQSPIPNPQSPIPNPQSPIPNPQS
ncbi:hypothetical protein, partial [Nostoc sp.]|uniref:hypothetical protein n=1 Tax=Nostoc sp. TaxID=1180 RepID=UPI002FF4D36E